MIAAHDAAPAAFRSIAMLTLSAALSACAMLPESTPRVAVPPQWSVGLPAAEPLTREWFRRFGSDELDTLVASAYRNSLDLQAADARLQQADARARAAGAPLLPRVDFGADATGYAGHSAAGSAHETDSGALLSASYEIDFWGRNRAARDSVRAARRASDADRAVVALTTVTGVANTYFEVIAARQERALAEEAAANAGRLLQLVEARAAIHLANPAEVAQQRALVANAQVRIEELRQQESAALAALALLIGAMPDSLQVTARDLDSLSLPRVAPGLPAELLARRPDVAAAEQKLRAAHANLLEARAAFFPTLTLTGSGGVQNPAVQAAVETLSGVGPTLSVGAALAQSIFDGGRLRAARDEASARELEMLASYRSAALAALWDVEIALAAIEHLDAQAHAQDESLTQSELGLASAQTRYRAGAGDFLAVLDAERALIAAREQMTHYRLARLQAAVGLCKALGGGWQSG